MAKIRKENGQLIDQDRKAYLRICQMLFNNELHPGQKIAYKELAQRLGGVSTTPVIHALKWLEFKGVVRREPNKGCFINTISLQEVDEIFETRLVLEVSLLPKTLKNLDREGLKNLETALKAHDLAVEENDFFKRVMTDLRFHMTLASLSKTNIQVSILEELFDRLLLKYSKDLFYVSIISTSQQEHYAVMDAIRKKDLNKLTDALTTHLKTTRERIVQGLTQFMSKNGKDAARYHSFEDIKPRDGK
jgi:DNA-binding GntR family transcriptional regulator